MCPKSKQTIGSCRRKGDPEQGNDPERDELGVMWRNRVHSSYSRRDRGGGLLHSLQSKMSCRRQKRSTKRNSER